MNVGYHEWPLCYDGRVVRYPGAPIAPCGCVEEPQRTAVLRFPLDSSPSFDECLACGATWDAEEGSEWKGDDE